MLGWKTQHGIQVINWLHDCLWIEIIYICTQITAHMHSICYSCICLKFSFWCKLLWLFSSHVIVSMESYHIPLINPAIAKESAVQFLRYWAFNVSQVVTYSDIWVTALEMLHLSFHPLSHPSALSKDTEWYIEMTLVGHEQLRRCGTWEEERWHAVRQWSWYIQLLA